MAKRKDAEDQSFQDIVIGSTHPEGLTISIVPHIQIHVEPIEVACLMTLMQRASAAKASYEDCNAFEHVGDGVGIRRMKDQNCILLGRFVEIDDLLDSQWVAIFKALKGWQQWAAEYEADDEYRVQVLPNKGAYAMWQEKDPEKVSALVTQDWHNIFDDEGVSLK